MAINVEQLADGLVITGNTPTGPLLKGNSQYDHNAS
jgi:hypothetical protein